ncbi:hypothetical protein COOONC_10499 [Cooperia oncophora]
MGLPHFWYCLVVLDNVLLFDFINAMRVSIYCADTCTLCILFGDFPKEVVRERSHAFSETADSNRDVVVVLWHIDPLCSTLYVHCDCQHDFWSYSTICRKQPTNILLFAWRILVRIEHSVCVLHILGDADVRKRSASTPSRLTRSSSKMHLIGILPALGLQRLVFLLVR